MRFILIPGFLCQLIIQTVAGQIDFATPYTFITMAGGGTKDTNGHPVAGFQNGQGVSVQFRNPYSLVFDKKGNAYVGDTYNHVIRKITPVGVVSTFCGAMPVATNSYGTLLGGYQDGPASTALFNGPTVGGIDSEGNLYVADTFNHVIRKITADGTVSTIAGRIKNYDAQGYPHGGYADGMGTNALFYDPHGLVRDPEGNLYVADSDNACVRRISPEGNVTTIAGGAANPTGGEPLRGYADGIGTNALFLGPWGIAVDSAGNLFVTDNHALRKITPVIADGVTNWTVTTLAGHPPFSTGHIDGTGTNAYFYTPTGIAVDAVDNLYVMATLTMQSEGSRQAAKLRRWLEAQPVTVTALAAKRGFTITWEWASTTWATSM